jgi:hypothetical protein
MRRIVYRGYNITAMAHQGEAAWHSRACVSRLRGGREGELREKSSFSTERQAEAQALRLGQYWVNKRLRLRQRLVVFLFIVGLALAAAGSFRTPTSA